MAHGPAPGWLVHGSTMDSTVAARQGLAGAQPSGRSGPRRLAVRRGKEGRCHEESNLANTEAWKVARRRLTGGEGAAVRAR
jgi:hypothetical protein